MALSLAEMESESVEYIPAREVMCAVAWQPPCHGQGYWHDQSNSCHHQGDYGSSTTTTTYQSSSGTYVANGGHGFSVLSGNNVLDGNNVSLNL